jgi:RNA polymerase sigma factor (sigma-70 family)
MVLLERRATPTAARRRVPAVPRSGDAEGEQDQPVRFKILVNLSRLRPDCQGMTGRRTGDGVDRRGDALLVVRAQLGDRQALAELVGRWHAPVWRYVRRMLDGPGRADDVSQEVWAGALKALMRLNQPERFAPWLFTIARRAVLDHLRERYGQPVAVAVGCDDGDDTGTVGGDDMAAVLDRAQITEGLAGVPPCERDVLILFYLQDLSLEECASVLDIPAGTVKSRLFRARRLLRDCLIEKGYTS